MGWASRANPIAQDRQARRIQPVAKKATPLLTRNDERMWALFMARMERARKGNNILDGERSSRRRLGRQAGVLSVGLAFALALSTYWVVCLFIANKHQAPSLEWRHTLPPIALIWWGVGYAGGAAAIAVGLYLLIHRGWLGLPWLLLALGGWLVWRSTGHIVELVIALHRWLGR